MVQKAFRRNGIRTTSEIDSEVSVLIDEVHEEYILGLKGKEYSRYSTIKGLLPGALELLKDRNTLKNKSYDER